MFKALNGLSCADVPLRNYSLTVWYSVAYIVLKCRDETTHLPTQLWLCDYFQVFCWLFSYDNRSDTRAGTADKPDLYWAE